MSTNTITIREERFDDPVFHLTVSFNSGAEYDVQLPNPATETQENRFEWYFEQHLSRPFLDGVKAQEIVREIARYGETLFTAIFNSDPNLFSDYRNCLNDGLSKLEFAIVGQSTAFHTIHWESLKAPDLPEAFAAGQANVFRKNRRPASVEAKSQPSAVINLLLVTARPDWEDDVNYRTIMRPVVDLIESAQLRVDAHILRPGTYQSLVNHLDEKPAGFYHIIHFDVHGGLLSYDDLKRGRERNRYVMQARVGLHDLPAYEGKQAFLLFEGDKKRQAVPVSADELANLLKVRHVPVCLLNACQSAKESGGPYQTSLGAKLMEAGVQAVLGQSYSITVSAAQKLMQTLYKTLFDRESLTVAVAKGRRTLALEKARKAYFDQTVDLEDWLLPVFYQNRPLRFDLRAFTPEEEDAYYERRETAYRASSAPTYGFVGRDLDILTIEKRLLNHNMLLVRGMGGTGKSTLLEHLANWWERTGFVKKSFYFGYDKRAYTLEQILHELARQLFSHSPRDLALFQSSSPAVQRGKIEDKLKTESYCLILDNCESITGHSLAIQNTLNADEQTKLRDFLARLRQQPGKAVKSIVLFGSRSDEQWLAPHTFDNNVYNLQGLDNEARTDLARRILERINLQHVFTDPEFARLMKLLAGYPLTMEVILPNLRRKTASDIITDLRAGDVNLDKPDGTDKTNSILQCVDYSHSNLSPDAQKLLLCLAPFTGYVNLAVFEKYIDELRQQPSFKDHPFEQWQQVINEAVKWGLMEPIAEGASILSLQPVFPYFLQQKLQATVPATGQQELDTAFRNHYDEFAGYIVQLLNSKQPEEKQLGKTLVQLEYENVYTALQVSLERHQSVFSTYRCLSMHLDTTNSQELGLLLAKDVLVQIEAYPQVMLTSLIGNDLMGVVDDIGRRSLLTQQFEEAKEAYQKELAILGNLQIYSGSEFKIRSASIFHQLGRVSQSERDWPQAKYYFHQALDIYDEFDDLYEQAATYHQLGRVAQEEQEWTEAKAHYQQALEIYITFKDRYSQARTYNQLGRVAQEEKEWTKAKVYYKQAFDLFRKFKDPHSLAKCYHNLGGVLLHEKKYSKAKNYYQKALATFIEYNDHYGKAGVYYDLGVMSYQERDWTQAKSYYEKSLLIYKKLEDEYKILDLLHLTGDFF